MALIVCVGLLAYSNSLSNPFVRDDHLSIVNNATLRDWSNWQAILAPPRELPTAGRPLVNLSLAMNYSLGGLEVQGYHLWNLAIHLICGLLVFAIVRRTLALPSLRDRFGAAASDLAFAIALVWVVHPLNSEVVNYVTQRTESMMALFYLLTMLAAIRGAAPDRSAKWETTAVLSCALGMGCKESMATAPLAVVLYDRVFIFHSLKQALRDRWRFYAALAATWLVLTALMRSGPRAYSAGFGSGVDSWTYLLNQAVMVTQYLRRAIWPQSLVSNYGFPVALTLADVWWQALVIVTLGVATLVALVGRPVVGFLGAWFFLTLAPASSIVPIATEVGAERRMYLPLIALVTLAVVIVFIVFERLAPVGSSPLDFARGGPSDSRRPKQDPSHVRIAAVCFVLALVLATTTMLRNREYHSPVGLARTVVERWPTASAHHVLGEELLRAGNRDEALTQLRAALPGAPRAHFSLGLALFNAGRFDEAIAQLETFVHEEPLFIQVPTARLTLARAFAGQGRWPLAIEQARLVLAMTPANVDARLVLADGLSKLGAHDDAVRYYREYLQARPNDRDALTNLGAALVATERMDEAVLAFRRAVDVAPGHPEARRNLATALFDQGATEQAAREAQQALTLDPTAHAMHVLVGRAFALQGKFDEARAHFERALEIDPTDAEARTYLDRLMQLRGGPGT